jgi:hypothetical protein
LGFLLALFLGIAALPIGITISTLIFGVSFHTPASELFLQRIVVFSQAGTASLLGGVFAWMAPLPTVRKAVAISGVVAGAFIAHVVFTIWSAYQLLSVP